MNIEKGLQRQPQTIKAVLDMIKYSEEVMNETRGQRIYFRKT